MILETLRLTNIKSFEDETLQFARGINVIAGRNGAGKSTVIEAVGIALFDAWPSKFKEGNARTGFIRRGKGEASIELTLSVDGKRYTIVCNLGERKRKGKDPTTDYERILYDAAGIEISASSGRKTEFQEDIRAHILGASRIEDDKLFENIIGTAQGAFDAPFTATESERRSLFERILGVEDFQKYEKQFARFVRFLGERVTVLRGKTEVLASSSSDLEQVKEELLRRTKEFAQKQEALTAARTAREEAQATYESAVQQKETVEKLRTATEQLRERSTALQETLAHHRREWETAKKAETEMHAHADGYAQYNAAESELIRLRQQAEDRNAHRVAYDERLRKHESVCASSGATGKELQEQRAHRTQELADLEIEQKQLEQEREKLLTEWKNLKAETVALREEEQYIERLDTYVTELTGVQKALIDKNSALRNLRDGLTTLERDADTLFRKKPALLKRETLDFVRTETAELFASVITEINEKIEARDMSTLAANVRAVLAKAREAVREKEKKLSGIQTQGASIRDALEKLGKRHDAKVGEIKYTERKITSENLALERESREWSVFLEQHTKAMSAFENLDERIADNEEKKKMHKNAFDAYILAVSDAAKCEERARLVTETEKQERTLLSSWKETETALAEAEKQYSKEEFEQKKNAFDLTRIAEQEAIPEAASAKTKVDEQRQRVSDAEKIYVRYTDLCAQTSRAEQEHGFFETVMKTIVRGLAQQVGARIVSSVSGYADQLYARIAPEQHASLVWDPMHYGVELHAPMGIVKGKELSGGQLMGVSLVIKLALIKWYSQSRIGFLDEPTTHLDKETRRHLSDVIMNLESIAAEGAWFDQLFVISHEEALNGAGHRIELAQSDGASHIALVD